MKTGDPPLEVITLQPAQTLAHRLNKARQEQINSALTKKPPFELRLPLKRKSRPTNRRHFVLPSGLQVREAAELAGSLAAALRKIGRDQPDLMLAREVSSTNVGLVRNETGWQVDLPMEQRPVGGNPEQATLARLFYELVTGNSLPAGKAGTVALGEGLEATAGVLEKGLLGGFTSAYELAGAFGWSLYRDDQARLAVPVRLEARRRPVVKSPVRQLDEADPGRSQPAPARGAAITAWASLAAAMILIVSFIVISVTGAPGTGPAGLPARTINSPTPTAPATMPAALQNSLNLDGVQVTRFNLALAGQDAQGYVSPERLPTGGVASLNGGYGLQVASALWSPGQNVYLGLTDGGWEVWDTTSGRRISRKELPNADQYAQISWSPDGEHFAALGLDGQLRLGSGGRVLKTVKPDLSNQGRRLYSFGAGLYYWSPNSQYLMVQQFDNRLRLWNFQGGLQELKINDPTAGLKFPGSNGQLEGWAWSGDSRQLAWFNDTTSMVEVYDLRDLKLAYTLDLKVESQAGQVKRNYFDQQGGPANLYWSPDGAYMALLRWYRDGNAGFPYSQKAELTLLETTRPGVRRGVTGPNARSGRQQSFELKDITLGGAGVFLDWSREGRLLVTISRMRDVVSGAAPVNRSNEMRVFGLDEDTDVWGQTWQSGLPGGVADGAAYNGYDVTYRARWSPEGRRVLVNATNGWTALYRVGPQGPGQRPPEIWSVGAGRQLTEITPSPDGRWLAVQSADTGRLEILETGSGQVKWNLEYPPNHLANIAGPNERKVRWSADSRYLAGFRIVSVAGADREYDYIIRVWQIENDRVGLYGDILLPAQFFGGMDWTRPPEDFGLNVEVISGVAAWLDLSRPPPPLETQKQAKTSGAVQFLPTPGAITTAEPLLAVPYRIKGRVMGITSRADRFTAGRQWFPDWQSVLYSSSVNPNSFTIQKLLPVNASPKQEAAGRLNFVPEPGARGGVIYGEAVRVSPDGRLVAFGLDNGLVQIYETGGGKLVQAIAAHQGAVTTLQFGPDSRSLATGGSDRTVKVWDIASGRATHMLRGHSGPVGLLQWLPDGRSLISQSGYNAPTTLLWKIK